MIAIAVILTVASIILIVAGARAPTSSASVAGRHELSRRSTAAVIASSQAWCAVIRIDDLHRNVPGP